MIQSGHLQSSQELHGVAHPMISVIIPVLQEEKLLSRTLSIFTPERKQRFGLEIIVSDGGSTDATLSIAHRYADTVICHEETRRQTIAEGRNKGAEHARGEVFIFMNADTFPADPDEFLSFVQEWSKLTFKPCALACPVHIYPEERTLADSFFSFILNTYIGAMVNIAGFGMGRGECQIFTRAAFFDAGMYDASIPAGEDFEIFRRTRKIGGLTFERQLLVFESPRRFRKFGYPRILLEWAVNWFWVLIFGKARSKNWEAVR